jgi:hypothetical protein
MALINKLSAIGDAIREKTGKEDLLTLDQMPEEIKGISGGGEEVEPIVLETSAKYACSGPIASKYIELFGNTVSTKNLRYADYMFYQYLNETIPFSVNFDPVYNGTDMSYFFSDAKNLKELPKINNVIPAIVRSLCNNCNHLHKIPQDYFDSFDWSYASTMTSTYSGYTNSIFNNCWSLREVPLNWLKNTNKNIASASGTYLYSMLSGCYSLDEALDIPLIYNTKAYTSNFFVSTFTRCSHLKRLTFALNEDHTPVVLKWKGQTIDLSIEVGYGTNTANFLSYNGGFTTAKRVYNDDTYQTLKNDPDYWTVDTAYSRYNHDSAVETINSLPDTSAYLATAGGTNTVKFKGNAGSKTDGGAINTLTEEEIAVATNKGWTITFV